MLHIHNGDCAANTLKHTDIPGESIVWCDVLHEGPTPANLAPDAWRRLRAQFHADMGFGSFNECLGLLSKMDEDLDKFRHHDEVILWFEHDLFDQLILIRLLHWFQQCDLTRTKLSLICIGEFPGVERFIGLGQLNPEQMATLFGTQHEVTDEEIGLAQAAWSAFCSPHPQAIEAVIRSDTSTLPFLRDALLRHLEEFPSTRNGLSRTERQILEVITSGHHQPAAIFRAAQEKEERPFMGDKTFWTHLVRLAKSDNPLLQVEGQDQFFWSDGQAPDNNDFREQTILLTEKGRDVLSDRDDWVKLNGIDRWLGGVHLYGAESPWRWDEQRRQLVHQE